MEVRTGVWRLETGALIRLGVYAESCLGELDAELYGGSKPSLVSMVELSTSNIKPADPR